VLSPLRWSMPKITKSDAKLSEIYEQNEWHLFPGNVIYDFLAQVKSVLLPEMDRMKPKVWAG